MATAIDFSKLLFESSTLPHNPSLINDTQLYSLSSIIKKLNNNIQRTELQSNTNTAVQSFSLQHKLKIDENRALLRTLDDTAPPAIPSTVSSATIQSNITLDQYLTNKHNELLNNLYFIDVDDTQDQIQSFHTISHQLQQWNTVKHNIVTNTIHNTYTVVNDTMSIAEQTYSTVMIEYNKKRYNCQLFSYTDQLCRGTELILKHYVKLNDTPMITLYNDVYDLFNMCNAVLNESNNHRIYNKIFLNNNSNTNQTELQRELIIGSIQYTQQLYDRYMTAMISNKSILVSEIRSVAYVRLHRLDSSVLKQKLHLYDTLNNQPIWPQIYYNIRVGNINNNIMLLDQCIQHGYIECRYIRSAVQNQLKCDPDITEQLQIEYHKCTSSHSTDIYKQLVYSILLKHIISIDEPIFDTIKLYILNTIEDIIFYYLSCVQYNNTIESLHHVQSILCNNHTSLHGNTLSYFKLLLLTQQYNHAVEFISKQPQYNIFTLHITPILYFYNLYTNTQLFQSFIQSHVMHYSMNYPLHVFHYIYTLHNTYTDQWSESTSDSSTELQCNLLLKTKYYELLVGTTTDTTVLQTGLLYEYYSHDHASYIVDRVAQQLYEHGDIIDSIQLYILNQQYTNAADILLQHLSLYTNQQYTVQRNDMIQLTTHYITLCPSNDTTTQYINDLNMLLQLCQFYDLIHLQPSHINDAVDLILQLNIVPLKHTDIQQCIIRYMNTTTILQSQLIIVYIQLCKLYCIVGQQQRNTIHAQQYKQYIRILITYIGLVNTSLTNEQNQQLIQCELAIS